MKNLIKNQGNILLVVIFLLGCGEKRSSYNGSAVEQHKDTSPVETTAIYYIRDKNDNTLGSLSLQDPVHVSWNEKSLFRLIREDKAKYRDDNNRNIFEIKFGEDGFKLRDPNGKLLWKIKNREGKIKISNNEEMTGPYEIRQSDAWIKISKNDTDIQKIETGQVSVPLMIKAGNETLFIAGPGKDPALAILALNDIPIEQQLIIIAELLLSGK